MAGIDAIDSAVFMVRNGYTTAEVMDALRIDKGLHVRHLRAALRYLDSDVPTELQARESRLNRIQRGRSPAEHMRLLIRQGLTNQEVQAAISKVFPLRKIRLQYVAQIRLIERQKNPAIPTCIEARRLRDKL